MPLVVLALYLAFGRWAIGPLPGGVLLAVAVFAYARAVGRLLFALTYEPPTRREGGPRRKRKPAAQPEPEPEPEPEPVRPPSTWEDEDATPYTALPAEVKSEQVVDKSVVEPKASEMKLLAPSVVRPSGPAWGLSVWTTFFGQSRTLGACGALSLFFVAVFAVFRTLLELNPVGRG